MKYIIINKIQIFLIYIYVIFVFYYFFVLMSLY